MFPIAAAPDSTPIFVVAQHRVPTVMENPGKKWSWKVMEKSWKRVKIQNVMEICLLGRKVMEISCPNLPNRVPIVL